jgi:hypothetical protein
MLKKKSYEPIEFSLVTSLSTARPVTLLILYLNANRRLNAAAVEQFKFHP